MVLFSTVDQDDKCDSDTNFDLWYSNAANGLESMVMALVYWLSSGVTVAVFSVYFAVKWWM